MTRTLASDIPPSSAARVLSVAPMLDWTDRHCRYFHRLLTKKTVLYTEMVTTGAIIHGKQDFLAFHPAEQPVVLQLGGSDPTALAHATELAAARGYKEVNLNVGCPSDRVQNGSFGACLMAEPELVGQCVAAMRQAADIKVSVKTRLGIDELDSDEFLDKFIDTVAAGGCQDFTLHARKAWLKGLSPKQNREIPPLQYERVYRAKARRPELHITLNGGVTSWAQVAEHLQYVDGVMIGREAYQNPWLLTAADAMLTSAELPVDDTLVDWVGRREVVEHMIAYTEGHIAAGGRAWHVARHMLGLYQQLPGAKRWRQYLSQQGPRADAAGPLFEGALAAVEAFQDALAPAEPVTADSTN